MLISTLTFAQTWEDVTLVNGDFSLPTDTAGYSGTSLTDTVPGWYAETGCTTSRSTAFLAVMGYSGAGVGGGAIYNIVDEKFEADMQYKLTYDVMCSWLGKMDSTYAMAYISSMDADSVMTKLDSMSYTLLPGKDAAFTTKELVMDMSAHADAIGKTIVLEFEVLPMAFKNGEMTTATLASWSQLDNVSFAKSETTTNLFEQSNLAAKVFVNDQLMTIEFPTLTQGKINIYAVGGQHVFSDNVNSSLYTQQLNLAKGVYIMQLDSNAGSKVAKFIVD